MQKAREAANRVRCQNNLKQVGLAPWLRPKSAAAIMQANLIRGDRPQPAAKCSRVPWLEAANPLKDGAENFLGRIRRIAVLQAGATAEAVSEGAIGAHQRSQAAGSRRRTRSRRLCDVEGKVRLSQAGGSAIRQTDTISAILPGEPGLDYIPLR